VKGIEQYPTVVIQPVQWGDMDAYQHVNNVVYLRWFETGRAAYFTDTAIWNDGIRGVAPIFHSVACRFRAPLTYPDDVVIAVRTKEVLNDRFVVEHAVYSKKTGVLAAIGDGTVVSIDYPRGEKVPLPDAWRAALAAHESRVKKT
jgi:acyl-CoA thioester hydrolase